MGLFDFLNSFIKDATKKNSESNNLTEKGNIEVKEVFLYSNVVEKLKSRYIAFDVETTGLSSVTDRIIELGAVLFENGNPVKRFSSLVNPNKLISSEATRVNKISNEMIKDAPQEKEIYPKLVEFFGDTLSGETIICAHNARFDIGFLTNTLERLGYNGNIKYIDTLSLSRDLICGLDNYKQDTVADYFEIKNEDAHRAVTDAETCGKILYRLLNYEIKEKEFKEKKEVIIPDKYEKIIFAYINKLIEDNDLDTDYLGLRKNSGGYINICYLYNFIKYKFCKKGKYIIISNKFKKNIENLEIEQCTNSEGGNEYIRVYINSVEDIKQLDEYILNEYKKANKNMRDYIRGSSRREKNIIEELDSMYQISIEEARRIIEEEIANNSLSKYLVKRHKEQEEQIKLAEKERQRKIKEQRLKEKIEKEELRRSLPKEPVVGRTIIQMNDEGVIINKYISIAEAVRQTGINSKSIRDAAKGVQKHAGGYCWRYEDNALK